MSTLYELCPPEGVKFKNLLSVQNALLFQYGETGDIRYMQISEKWSHILEAAKFFIKESAITEQVQAHGYSSTTNNSIFCTNLKLGITLQFH